MIAFDTNLLVGASISLFGQTLEWYKLGADFADAIHLCIYGERLMHTFDGEFCKAASKSGLTPAFKILK